MKKIIISILALATLAACNKDDFWDRFGPEVLFYQYNDVETADFIEITLPMGTTEYVVKARCSAPNKLAKVEMFRDGTSVFTKTDITEQIKPTEYYLQETVSGLSQQTVVRITATDLNGKKYSKELTIRISTSADPDPGR